MEKMIASFQVDHTKILPGIYVSRVDAIGKEKITTFDVRMKRPNIEPAIHPNALHTIEHCIATYIRNDAEWKDRIVYWGPMGCLTGNYLIVKGMPSPREIAPLLIRAFEWLGGYDGGVPGATPMNCGNFKLHDLAMARYEAIRYAGILKYSPCYDYPVTERLVTGNGDVFHDA